jgi:hypothetical protein
MTDTAGEIKKVFAALRDRPLVVDPKRSRERRERALPELRRALHAAHGARKRRGRYRALALALLSAVLASTVLMLSSGTEPAPGARLAPAAAAPLVKLERSAGTVVLATAAGERRLPPGEPLTGPLSGELRTSESGSARLATVQGLALTLSSATRVDLLGFGRERGDDVVRLNQGELTCDVPKLALGRTFSVVTADARIVVHGTMFSVRAGQGDQPTCVRVLEGLVSVQSARGQVTLASGQSFGCDPISAPANPPARVEASTRPRTPREALPKRSGGTLGTEADLLVAALAAERAGQHELARAKLQTLLSDYPSSPLVPEARQAMARIASRTPAAN